MEQCDTRNSFVELGYWICQSVQGFGIMTKSCRALSMISYFVLILKYSIYSKIWDIIKYSYGYLLGIKRV